jgi:hypothetical protein
MFTSDSTNDSKTAKTDPPAIQDLPEPKSSRALTADEEANVKAGATNTVNSSRSNIKGN